MSVNEELEEKVLGELQDIFIELKDELWESLMERSGTPVDAMDYGIDALEQFKVLLKDQQLSLINKIEELESMQDEQGMGGDCKEGCMFTEECDTSCGINADPADGFGKCTCGAELAEPTPPSQIEEEKLVLTLLELWEEYPGEPVGESVLFEPKGTIYSKDSFSGFMEWLRNNTK